MKKVVYNALFFMALYLVLVPHRAEAYLDPGTGSYILQVLAAVVFAGLFMLKTWWTHIVRFFSKLSGRKEDDTEKSSKKSE